jgi:hypothetical protein
MNLEISLAPADDLKIQHLYRTIISRRKLILIKYSTVLHRTIIPWSGYDTVLSSAGAIFTFLLEDNEQMRSNNMLMLN